MRAFFRWLTLFFFMHIGISCAQQGPPPQPDPKPADESVSASDEPQAVKPKRPRVAHPAEFQGPGVLQLEYGFDGNYRSKDLLADQAASLTLSLSVLDRLEAEFDLDTLAMQTDRSGVRWRGIGDAYFGFQLTTLEDTRQHPSLAFAYFVKLPLASEAKGLGSGRVDHKIVGLMSRKVGATDIDFNAAMLVNGREHKNGWLTGSQFALGFSRDLKQGFGVQGELSHQNLDTDQPRGTFALGALNYKANWRIIFDAGMRVGFTADTPRFGVFAGLTIGIANFYRKHR
jgi:Putative MetA-pathway of phenol degradation